MTLGSGKKVSTDCLEGLNLYHTLKILDFYLSMYNTFLEDTYISVIKQVDFYTMLQEPRTSAQIKILNRIKSRLEDYSNRTTLWDRGISRDLNGSVSLSTGYRNEFQSIYDTFFESYKSCRRYTERFNANAMAREDMEAEELLNIVQLPFVFLRVAPPNFSLNSSILLELDNAVTHRLYSLVTGPTPKQNKLLKMLENECEGAYHFFSYKLPIIYRVCSQRGIQLWVDRRDFELCLIDSDKLPPPPPTVLGDDRYGLPDDKLNKLTSDGYMYEAGQFWRVHPDIDGVPFVHILECRGLGSPAPWTRLG